MPDVAFLLENTDQAPAALFVTYAPNGSLELVLQGLPVRIELPHGILAPLRTVEESASSEGGLSGVRSTAPFNPMHWDSLEVVLSDTDVSFFRVRVNVRLTATGDVLVEPVVPISIGPCRYLGIPCKGVHDLQLQSTLFPRHVPSQHIPSEIPLRWARHDLTFAFRRSSWPSALIARTVDPDPTWGLYRSLLEAVGTLRQEGDDAIELVAEDLVLPFDLPLPVHGRLSLRKRLLQNPQGDPYDMQTAPVRFEVCGTEIAIFRFMIQSSNLAGESPVALEVAWRAAGADDDGRASADVVSVSDDGSLVWGALFEHKPKLFRIAGRDIHVAAARLGVSFPGIVDRADAPWAWAILLADFELRSGNSAPPGVGIEAKSGKVGPVRLLDVGWRAGQPSLGSLRDPANLEYKASHRRVEIHELGLVGDNDGGLFLSVSGGLHFGGDFGAFQERATTPEASDAKKNSAVGVYLYRLRFRLGEGSPAVQLDGARINLKRGPTELSGFGMLSEYERAGSRFREFGFDIRLALHALGRDLELGAQLLYGSASGAETYKYWLAGLQVSPVPVGPVELHDVRALGAGNMTPSLAPADGTEQPMRLLRWFKQGDADALSLPLERKLAAWVPKDHSVAFGVGLTVAFGGSKAVRLAGFLFVHFGPDESGVLVGLEVFMLEATKPIAYGALEWDGASDRFQLLLGFDVTLSSLISRPLPSFLAHLAALTGTFYASNRPTTVAIGYYNDPASWPAVRFSFTKGAHFEGLIALCYHRVCDPDPDDSSVEALNVLGLVASMKGGIDLGRLGKMQVYTTLQWVNHLWRNEALPTGHTVVLEAGVRIKLFGCFRFGASINVDLSWLGPSDVDYERHSAVFRIETPWYLPDVTIRWDWTRGLPQPEQMEVVSLPLASASALPPGGGATTTIGTTRQTGLPANRPVHDMSAVRASTSVVPTSSDFAELVPVATDATIVLDFAAAMDADATALPATPSNAGVQSSNELATRYRITAIGVRRRAHFGPRAGQWLDLVEPTTTHLPPLADLPEGTELEALFRSQLRMEWDADLQRVGRTDPRRLLINSTSPFTLTSRSSEVDERLVAWWPQWPCCPPAEDVPWHTVRFDHTLGQRAPVSESFSASSSSWRWMGRPPAVGLSEYRLHHAPAAHVEISGREHGAIAYACFDGLAYACELFTFWPPLHSHAELVIDAYRGMVHVSSRSFPVDSPSPPGAIRFEHLEGITALVLRKAGAVESRGVFIEMTQVRYQSLDEVRAARVNAARCRGQRDQVIGKGRLAWLPNHDYEISVRTRIDLEYDHAGSQAADVEQRAFFRTKGLPGLNAAARVGDELESYIESTYPAAGARLYRLEPFAVAFNETFNVFAPVDNPPNPDDPDERQQLLEWHVTIAKEGADGLTRMSESAVDWLSAQRGGEPPPWPIVSSNLVERRTRRATTANRFRQRFEHLLLRPGGCGTAQDAIHGSQVLIHAPVDSIDGTAVTHWAADQGYVATLRRRNAPFIDRPSFVESDLGAMTFASTSGSAAPWTVTDGRIHPVPSPSLEPQYALVGDPDWDHLRARAVLYCSGTTAGVALAAAGAPVVSQAVVATVDASSSSPWLRLTELTSGVTRVLAEAPIAADNSYSLELAAFDDRWRAQVGDVVVEVPRGSVRTGRLAFVSRGGASVGGVSVSGLAAYAVPYRTSRYDDFASHVATFRNTSPPVAVAEIGTVSTLLSTTTTEMTDVMTPAAARERRERVFEHWIGALDVPLRTSPSDLSIARVLSATGSTLALVLESPEPLSFSTDVVLSVGRRLQLSVPTDPVAAWLAQLERDGSTLVGPPLPNALARLHHLVWRNQLGATEVFEVSRERTPGAAIVARAAGVQGATARTPATSAGPAPAPGPSTSVQLFDRDGQALSAITPLTGSHSYGAVPVRVLSSGDECRVIVVPVTSAGDIHAPFGADTLRLTLSIDRARYRVQGTDPASRYTGSVRLFLWLAGVVDDTM